jgi:hypothetical protein
MGMMGSLNIISVAKCNWRELSLAFVRPNQLLLTIIFSEGV